MIYVDDFLLEVFEDLNEPKADLDIIIPRAVIKMLKETNIFERGTIANGLVFLNQFFHDEVELPGRVGDLPDYEKELLKNEFIPN